MPNPKPILRIDTDVREAFHAYHDSTHYYLVTHSGQVHTCPKDGKAKRTTCIWKDPKRPVRLLLKDNGSGKTWAFAPRKDSADKTTTDVYFSLAKKIEPIAFDASVLPDWKPARPMDMALAHGRFLLEEKKITLTEKPPATPDKKK